MAEKLINITAQQYRCPMGDCPAVYKSEDGKTLVIVGEKLDPLHEEGLAGKVSHTEAAVKISADLVLSSLGLPALIEAAEPILKKLNFDEAQHQELYEEALENNAPVLVPAGLLRALREALSSIKGGKS